MIFSQFAGFLLLSASGLHGVPCTCIMQASTDENCTIGKGGLRKKKKKKRRNHTFALGKILFLSVPYNFRIASPLSLEQLPQWIKQPSLQGMGCQCFILFHIQSIQHLKYSLHIEWILSFVYLFGHMEEQARRHTL